MHSPNQAQARLSLCAQILSVVILLATLSSCSTPFQVCPNSYDCATLVSVTLSPTNPAVPVGSTEKFSATGKFDNGGTLDVSNNVTWSSEDPAVATVSKAGVATAVGLGRTAISVKSDTVTAMAEIIVLPDPSKLATRYGYTVNSADGTLSQFSVNTTTGKLRGHGYVPAAKYAGGIAVEPRGKFAYVLNSNANNVLSYGIDPATGVLTALSVTPVLTGTGSNALLVDPSGSFLYVANEGSSNISGFSIGPSTGALTAITGSPFPAGSGPASLAIDPAGKFLFSANGASNNVSAFTIDAVDGKLTEVQGSPFAAGSQPSGIAVSPALPLVFVSNEVSATVSVYSADPSTGELTPIPGSPFSTGAGQEISGVTVDASGAHLYVSNFGSQSISVFNIVTDGSLVAVAGSPFPVNGAPRRTLIDPSGSFAYVPMVVENAVEIYSIGTTGAISRVSTMRTGAEPLGVAFASGSSPVAYTPQYVFAANNHSNDISSFSVNSASGTLSPVGTGAIAAGTAPSDITSDPSGKFTYVANVGSNSVSAYSASSGALTPLAGSPFPALGDPVSVRVDPAGRFAFVGTTANIVPFLIDPTSGFLTANTAPNAVSSGPVAVDPTGRFAFVANFNANMVSAFSIDLSTGLITPVAGSPYSAGVGKNPLGILVDPSGQFLYVSNTLDDTISVFSIDPAYGSLTPLTGPLAHTGTDPRVIAIDPDGKFLYTANFGSGNVSAFTIGPDGALAAVSGSPFPAGAGILAAAVDPSGKFLYVADNSPGTVVGFAINADGSLIKAAGSPFVAGSGTDAITIVGKWQ